MWAQAGFRPDDFWGQTPLHFQLAMRGVRKRMEQDEDRGHRHAYLAGRYAAIASAGKLKAYSHYVDKGDQTPHQMLEMLKAMGTKSNMTVRRVKRAND